MGKTYLQGEVLTAADLNASLNEAVNTSGYFVFTGSHVFSNLEVFNANVTVNSTSFFVNAASSFTKTVTLGAAAPLISSNNISDKIGEVRTVTVLDAPGGKTLDASDHGKVVSVQSTVTIPANVFTAGQNVTIYNNTDANLTILQGGGLTLYLAGIGSTGNRTTQRRGLVTVVFISGTVAVITGAGIT